MWVQLPDFLYTVEGRDMTANPGHASGKIKINIQNFPFSILFKLGKMDLRQLKNNPYRLDTEQ